MVADRHMLVRSLLAVRARHASGISAAAPAVHIQGTFRVDCTDEVRTSMRRKAAARPEPRLECALARTSSLHRHRRLRRHLHRRPSPGQTNISHRTQKNAAIQTGDRLQKAIFGENSGICNIGRGAGVDQPAILPSPPSIFS
jgi:hypothetical protein